MIATACVYSLPLTLQNSLYSQWNNKGRVKEKQHLLLGRVHLFLSLEKVKSYSEIEKTARH